MNIMLLHAAVLYGSGDIAFAQSLDKSKPYGRAAVGVVNTANGDEAAFQAVGRPGPNKKVVVHFDATAKCEVLVAPFNKSGQLANGWPPHFVKVAAGKELQLPNAPVT